MKKRALADKAAHYVSTLCSVKPNRSTGSPGNRTAVEFCARTFRRLGYAVDTAPFACLDFESKGALLSCGERHFPVCPSPFSLGCDAEAELAVASTFDELHSCSCRGKILLLKGEIACEQLMPKRFVFYNPRHHQEIVALLEKKRPAAVVTATGKNPGLVGAEYPFPMIEDGDFSIPSVYCKDVVGEKIALLRGEMFRVTSRTKRIPSRAANVIARKNPHARRKIVVCAHIDARANTPGASDNASGVSVLLMLAELIADKRSSTGVEMVAFNGEDHFGAGGQMDYLRRYRAGMNRIVAAVNVDDIGYRRGKTAFSFYECPREIRQRVRTAFRDYGGLVEGEPWHQGDHMLFVQNEVPAVALTSDKMRELMARFTHTQKDTAAILDFDKLAEAALALKDFILG